MVEMNWPESMVVRPEYEEKLKRIEKEKGIRFRTVDELRASLEKR